jgi:uncharacterized repeat protein (TIGR01451 family)
MSMGYDMPPGWSGGTAYAWADGCPECQAGAASCDCGEFASDYYAEEFSTAGRDEYLCDGGDLDPEVVVRPSGQVDGLDQEDAIAHYDAETGETLVQPSTRVCIYAPRFAVVRQVVAPEGNQQIDQPIGVILPEEAITGEARQLAEAAVHRDGPRDQITTSRLTTYVGRQGRDVMSGRQAAMRADEDLKPHANLQFVTDGVLRQAEKAIVAEAVDAAVTWTREQAVQVVIDDEAAVALISDQAAQDVYVVEWLPGKPELRVVKMASARDAQVGDEIEFTIRFDNLGAQTLGHVVILDHLSPRLEYVNDSAQTTLPAQTSFTTDDDGSIRLRCELEGSLPPGQGGVLTFRCRVR